MVVKSELKLIKSLQQKKCRKEHGMFVMEGKKAVSEVLLSSLKVYALFVTKGNEILESGVKPILVTEKELQQMSGLKNPNGVLGVFHIPEALPIKGNGWILMLDGIQDPGNMGTIIRLCDWFGITNVVCSKETVDCYNPKVLQATMGAITRINILYEDLDVFLESTTLPVYGTFMGGASVYGQEFPQKGILIMGNEGQGISERIHHLCQHKIGIPQFGKMTGESLNVATATAILLSEIRRDQS
ncbi:TrmH family RNA methyltransferase [Maribacter sp. 2210JD10-5]|uniref:TrmH family RNA methyltransferase n=1 Tax=Maribacter sp. 2210JD10-5 TaxID=3386272 RepID=UPI0039BC3B7F